MGQKVSTSENLDSPIPKKDNHPKQKKLFHLPEGKASKNSIFNFQNGIL